MKINRGRSRLLKPAYHTPTHPPTDALIPLSPFETVTFQIHVGILYAYRPPNPSNEVIEQGLRRVLAEYREFAGRLIFNDNGHQCILLNDEGMRFIEATCDSPLGSSIDKPSPYYLDLHPDIMGIEELAQVQLTRLVDSRDIVELQLKQLDCELVIRKKEALPQPLTPAPMIMAQPPALQAVAPSQLPSAPAIVPAAAPSRSAPAPPAKPTRSSHPPLKCPMAGTFYRSPAPGEPAFVKIGDKVKKGQVLCIIEAMKLMNEIEADQSGTVVEILVDDGKPVSADMPLFVIEP